MPAQWLCLSYDLFGECRCRMAVSNDLFVANAVAEWLCPMTWYYIHKNDQINYLLGGFSNELLMSGKCQILTFKAVYFWFGLLMFTLFILGMGPYGAHHHLWTWFPLLLGTVTFNCFIQHHSNRLHLGDLLLRNWEFFYTSQNYFLSTFFTLPRNASTNSSFS